MRLSWELDALNHSENASGSKTDPGAALENSINFATSGSALSSAAQSPKREAYVSTQERVAVNLQDN